MYNLQPISRVNAAQEKLKLKCLVCYEILILLHGLGHSRGLGFGQNLLSYIFQNATVNLKETQQVEKNLQHSNQFSYNFRGLAGFSFY